MIGRGDDMDQCRIARRFLAEGTNLELSLLNRKSDTGEYASPAGERFEQTAVSANMIATRRFCIRPVTLFLENIQSCGRCPYRTGPSAPSREVSGPA
jgi:hypothetical protein